MLKSFCNELKKEENIKIVESFLFFLLAFAAITSGKSLATSYEASIYNSTPIIFWISVYISTAFSLIAVLFSTYNHSFGKYRLSIPMFILFMSFIMLLGLPIIRGYYILNGEGDTGTHLGFFEQIINNGHIPANVFYPILHIYTAELSLISNCNIIWLHKLVPFFF